MKLVRAPQDVRPIVESWLAKEQCATPLTVRIVETEGGYYIFAQDDRGRIQERIVPDAQSAGVLIASWTADDGIEKPAPPSVPEPAPVSHAEAIAPTLTLTTRHPRVKQPEPPANHWVTLAGGMQGTNHQQGVQIELEVLHSGGFSADLAVAYASAEMTASDGVIAYTAGFDDISGMIGLHYTWQFMRDWHARFGFGVGVMATAMTLDASGVVSNPQLSTAVSQASAMLGYALGENWAVEVGPVVTIANEHWHLADEMETLVRAPVSLVAYAGLRHAL